MLMYVVLWSDFCITFQRSSGYELVAFVDARNARQATDRMSVSGGVMTCASDCVWRYWRTQIRVTLSTTDIERGDI